MELAKELVNRPAQADLLQFAGVFHKIRQTKLTTLFTAWNGEGQPFSVNLRLQGRAVWELSVLRFNIYLDACASKSQSLTYDWILKSHIRYTGIFLTPYTQIAMKNSDSWPFDGRTSFDRTLGRWTHRILMGTS